MLDRKTTIERLCSDHSKEHLAEVICDFVKSEVFWRDNGCGNVLDAELILEAFVGKKKK